MGNEDQECHASSGRELANVLGKSENKTLRGLVCVCQHVVKILKRIYSRNLSVLHRLLRQRKFEQSTFSD